MSHYIKICKICGTVISQCRCMSCEKTRQEGICKKCEERPESPVDSRVTGMIDLPPCKNPSTERSRGMSRGFKDIYGGSKA